jgi:hypothetical protein
LGIELIDHGDRLGIYDGLATVSDQGGIQASE